MVTLTLRNVKGSPLTNTEVDTNFSNLNAAVQPSGGTAGQILSKIDATNYNAQWIDNYSTTLEILVRNETGSTIPKGSVVYIAGRSGSTPLIQLAKADALATSQAIGITKAAMANNTNANIVVVGELDGVNTSGFAPGVSLYLSPTTAGAFTDTKPTAPNYAVRIGFSLYNNVSAGQLFASFRPVYVNASDIIGSIANSQLANSTITINGTPIALGGNVTTTGGTVTSVGGTGSVNGITLTGTVTSSGSLTLGGSLTGTATSLSIGGNAATATTATSATTATTSTNLAGGVAGAVPYQSGVGTTGFTATGTTGQILQSNGTGAPTWVTFTGGATITDDTTTNATRYPLYAAATSGTLSSVYTSSTEYTWNPLTGDLKTPQIVATNGLIENSSTVSNSYTVATGNNAFSVGPMTIASGKTVTVSSGQRWVIL